MESVLVSFVASFFEQAKVRNFVLFRFFPIGFWGPFYIFKALRGRESAWVHVRLVQKIHFIGFFRLGKIMNFVL